MATLWHPPEHVVVLGRKQRQPWSAPVDLKAIGVIPPLVGGVSAPRLIASCCASRSLGRVFQADRDASRTLSPTCAPKSRLLLPAYFAPSAA